MRTCIVTGATSGIGLAVAHALESQGERVVIVARDSTRGTAICGDLAQRTRNPNVELVVADLAEQAGVRSAADALLARCDRIDALVHNAGVWPAGRELTADGFERAFATNHLAPFALNARLRDRLVGSAARVVQVSAGLAVRGAIDPERAPRGDDFHPIRTYASTKLWNLVATLEWARRLAGTGVAVNPVHPGVVRTGLGDRPGFLGAVLALVKRTWSTPEEGAAPIVRLATAPELAGVTGRWFDRGAQVELPASVTDPALAERVWAATEALIG